MVDTTVHIGPANAWTGTSDEPCSCCESCYLCVSSCEESPDCCYSIDCDPESLSNPWWGEHTFSDNTARPSWVTPPQFTVADWGSADASVIAAFTELNTRLAAHTLSTLIKVEGPGGDLGHDIKWWFGDNPSPNDYLRIHRDCGDNHLWSWNGQWSFAVPGYANYIAVVTFGVSSTSAIDPDEGDFQTCCGEKWAARPGGLDIQIWDYTDPEAPVNVYGSTNPSETVAYEMAVVNNRCCIEGDSVGAVYLSFTPTSEMVAVGGTAWAGWVPWNETEGCYYLEFPGGAGWVQMYPAGDDLWFCQIDQLYDGHWLSAGQYGTVTGRTWSTAGQDWYGAYNSTPTTTWSGTGEGGLFADPFADNGCRDAAVDTCPTGDATGECEPGI